MSSELVSPERLWPFGKYRGQAVERAMADHSYMEWVLAQPWFPEDYPKIHGLIIGTSTGEPQDSPEHNAFQIRFLDEEVRLAVARRLGFQELDSQTCSKRKAIARKVAKSLDCPVPERQLPLSVSAVKFEDQGWDVAFEIRPASYVAWLDAAAYGKPYIELLESWGMAKLAAKTKARLRESHATLDVSIYEPNTARRPRVVIELKPDLGDDYPSVLRQIQRYPVSKKGGDRKLLIVRRARFTTVSYEQVKAFFKSADITLLMEWELEIPEQGAISAEAKGVADVPAAIVAPSSIGPAASTAVEARSTQSPVAVPIAAAVDGLQEASAPAIDPELDAELEALFGDELDEDDEFSELDDGLFD